MNFKMEVKKITDTVWMINGDTIVAETKESAIKKYWDVRSQI